MAELGGGLFGAPRRAVDAAPSGDRGFGIGSLRSRLAATFSEVVTAGGGAARVVDVARALCPAEQGAVLQGG